ncbi:MAG: heme ABC exporter ATP-binding protein CcmA [Alphaproteobacteria bacterium]|nr:heme ABC exporter ATP-binding protein CcmA [Alphaproteobacteria bacterium]
MADVTAPRFAPTLALQAINLACERGGRRVFSQLEFTISGGEAVELRGPNGAGKSSLLRLIAGLNTPAEGALKLTGTGQEIPELSHYIGHFEAVKPALSVAQNLAFWASLMGGSADGALKPFRLERLADDPAQLLSEGQRRRLALSRLVAARRPIWLLDEPTVGLDAAALDDLRREMLAHLAAGGLIIAATHASLGLAGTRTITIGAAA